MEGHAVVYPHHMQQRKSIPAREHTFDLGRLTESAVCEVNEVSRGDRHGIDIDLGLPRHVYVIMGNGPLHGYLFSFAAQGYLEGALAGRERRDGVWHVYGLFGWHMAPEPVPAGTRVF